MATTEDSVDEPVEGSEPTKQKLSLDVSVENVSACKRHVKVSIPREDIDRYIVDALDDLIPKAEVKGFRPGRAPRKLVEHQFKDEIRERVKGALLLDSLQQVNEEHELSAISEPDLDVQQLDIPEDGPFTFEFDLEVRPDFEMPDWKGLKLERPVHELSDKDVQTQLGDFLRQHVRLVPYDGAAEAEDFLAVNITFNHEGQQLNRLEEQLVRVRPQVSFRDGTIDGFDKLMTGAKAGDKKTATAAIGSSAADENLRGKKVNVEFEVLEVKREELPQLTPTFVQQTIGLENEEQFRDAARDYLERRIQYHQNQSIRQQITKQLTAGADWDLPADLLRRQSRRELERAVMELQSNGFSMEEINAHTNQLLQNVNATTAAALREHFILERIAEEQEIEASDADYELEILRLARSRNESPRRVKARLEKRGQMDTLRNQIIEQKVIDLVMEHAQFKEVPFELPANKVTAVPHAIGGQEEEEEIPEAQGGEAEELRQPVDRG